MSNFKGSCGSWGFYEMRQNFDNLFDRKQYPEMIILAFNWAFVNYFIKLFIYQILIFNFINLIIFFIW